MFNFLLKLFPFFNIDYFTLLLRPTLKIEKERKTKRDSSWFNDAFGNSSNITKNFQVNHIFFRVFSLFINNSEPLKKNSIGFWEINFNCHFIKIRREILSKFRRKDSNINSHYSSATRDVIDCGALSELQANVLKTFSIRNEFFSNSFIWYIE